MKNFKNATRKSNKEQKKKREKRKPRNIITSTIPQKTLPKVINLSTKPLSKMAQSILINKGLKFTPLPKKNTVELEADIRNFTRKLRLMEFSVDRREYNDPSLVNPPSTFTPERGRDRLLDIYVDFLHNLPLNQ